ncbi:unnamed protein product [Microthlaspi erraticum]|uniref:F-box domain-containing protein n=1 Tax=Microthlaspi erraticum TaxID=1685480 RepID=A0A6D2JSN1_9BRAS|nr:unnamed protein product [Microthlaspi erraticum]CAA7042813.1 unnamed protein product [Microthlaspi erraticum]
MEIPYLPDEILYTIFKAVGECDAKNLGSLLRAGKRALRLVYKEDLLRTCNIQSLYMENHEDILEGGKARCFFDKCLRSANPVANYVEALNRIIHLRDMDGGIELLESNGFNHPKSTLAAALCCACSGDDCSASKLFKVFISSHGHLHEEGAITIGC